LTLAQQVLDVIHTHAHWAGPIAFALALTGSFVGLNVFIPAGTILTAISPLVGVGIVSWTIVLWAALGASLGCAASYGLGVWIGPAARRGWPFATRGELLQRAEDVLARHGSLAIFVGYFLGPLRSSIPVVAGFARMPHARFQLTNVFSALVWAVAAVVPGALLSASYEAGSLSTAFSLLMAGCTLLVITIVLYLRRRYRAKPPASRR
jgi:membrane protein DedA with SNARE-associated domain